MKSLAATIAIAATVAAMLASSAAAMHVRPGYHVKRFHRTPAVHVHRFNHRFLV